MSSLEPASTSAPSTSAPLPVAYIETFPSPVGPVLVAVDEDGALIRCDFGAHGELEGFLRRLDADWEVREDPTRTAEARRQLEAYFAVKLLQFDLPLAPRGTPFQQEVWRQLCLIPYGETRSYGQIAEAMGRPKAVRAVGAANGANPIGIVVPCHRVIGSSGSLTGYAGGLPVKRFLLELESGQVPLLDTRVTPLL